MKNIKNAPGDWTRWFWTTMSRVVRTGSWNPEEEKCENQCFVLYAIHFFGGVTEVYRSLKFAIEAEPRKNTPDTWLAQAGAEA